MISKKIIIRMSVGGVVQRGTIQVGVMVTTTKKRSPHYSISDEENYNDDTVTAMVQFSLSYLIFGEIIQAALWYRYDIVLK